MKKAYVIAIVLCVILLLAFGVVLMLVSFGGGQIEDLNGDDTSLCSLTEDDILRKNTSYVSFAASKLQFGNDYQYNVKQLSGVLPIAEFSAMGENLTIICSTKIHQGNLRIVVLCNGEYIADIPALEDQSLTIDNPSGNYEIRLAAESAQIEMEYSYSIE